MQKTMKFLSFWSINDSLELTSLKKQMLQLKKHGIEGVVFHPRFYPGNPDYLSDEYMDILSQLILYAKKLGMEFWMYDENGWPSGVAGGEVFRRHPDSVMEWVEFLEREKVLPTDTVLSTHENYCAVLKKKPGITPLNKTTTETFLAVTHQKFKERLKKEAFDYIIGFFADEVGFGGHEKQAGLPWCETVLEKYQEKYQESLTDHIWKLFLDAPDSPTIRIRFWETITDILAESFYLPYTRWCNENGKLFTAHLKGEETPYFQLPHSGSCFAQLKNITLPAIDTLERYPGNHFFPRIVSSLAKQYGASGCLAEAMGGAGWGVGPQDLRNYMHWLAESGIDRVVLHLCQLKLSANGIRDWPPSVPFHLTWHEGYAETLELIRKETKPLLAQADRGEKVLIVTPTRGVTAAYTPLEATQVNQHNGTNMPNTKAARITENFMKLVENCYQSGMQYHLTEEREFSYAKFKNGFLQIGKCKYSKVIIPEGCIFEGVENDLVRLLKENNLLISPPAESPSPKPACAAQPVLKPKQGSWRIYAPMTNQLFLQLNPNLDGTLSAGFANIDYAGFCTLNFSDPVDSVSVNGVEVAGTENNTSFLLPKQTGRIELLIKPQLEKQPFAFLSGGFSVVAMSGFKDFDANHRCTPADFALRSRPKPKEGCLLEQGLPFYQKLITSTKQFSLNKSISGYLNFDGVKAIAARVTIDGKEIGWWWKGRKLAVKLAKGNHTLKLECAQSTFNIYGPHRYYLGDYPLICGLHYKGIKNFADAPSAPDNTFTDDWKFVRFEVTGNILIEE